MKLLFDTRGNEKQKQCAVDWVNPLIEVILYGGAKGGAKSFTGCSLIFGDAFIYPETHYFIARKQLTDLRNHTIPSIYEVFDFWGIDQSYYKYNGQDNYFELYNGSKVFLIAAKYLPSDPNYARFGSMQMTRGWIEEAGEFEMDSYTNLRISIGRWKNDQYNLSPKLLLTANPAKNFLYKEFYEPYKQGTLPEWYSFIKALITDNKEIPAEYIENLQRTLKGAQRERLLLGNWEYDDSPDALIKYENIISIFENTQVQEDLANRHLIADIARQGSDLAVIMVKYGWVIKEIIAFEKSKITEIQAAIQTLQVRHQIPRRNCIADEDGVGGGLVDITGIQGFLNGAKALNNENYQNLKTQCYYKLADLINKDKIYISAEISEKHRQAIINDLEWVRSRPTDGKLKIISKDEVKQNIGRSPDFSDTLAMGVWFDIAPKIRYAKRNF